MCVRSRPFPLGTSAAAAFKGGLTMNQAGKTREKPSQFEPVQWHSNTLDLYNFQSFFPQFFLVPAHRGPWVWTRWIRFFFFWRNPFTYVEWCISQSGGVNFSFGQNKNEWKKGGWKIISKYLRKCAKLNIQQILYVSFGAFLLAKWDEKKGWKDLILILFYCQAWKVLCLLLFW